MAAVAILKNRLTYIGRNLSDFDKIWHGNSVRSSSPFRPPSWKSRYLGKGLNNRHEILHGYAYWPSEQVRHLKFPTFTNQRWRTAAILKNKNGHMFTNVW